MKNQKKSLFYILIVSLTLINCKEDDEPITVLNEEANQFVWQAMNAYYFWQGDVEDLSDAKFNTPNALYAFLNQFGNPETLFGALLFEDDRFSWIVDDYEELDNAFQGISKSFGYEYKLVRIGKTSDIFGFVKYVLPNAPASEAGLTRGDIFYAVDGTELTDSNFRDLLLNRDSYTLSMGEFTSVNEGVSDAGRSVSMSSVVLTENPILLSKVIDLDGTKVGYLVYNQFVDNNAFHLELNNLFGDFKNEGISEMVLDLRYNPGGSIRTTRILASLLYGVATDNTLFGSIVYNEKLTKFNSSLTFLTEIPLVDENNSLIGTEMMNRLNIGRIYILTSGNTASASELIIVGLLPYMDVTIIGTTTVGKNVGSVTLYDSPRENFLSNDPSALNSGHTYAIQPIISQLANSKGFTEYTNGFDPTIEVDELNFIGNLKQLGDLDEPLLAEALSGISGTARRSSRVSWLNAESLFDSRGNKRYLQTIRMDGQELK